MRTLIRLAFSALVLYLSLIGAVQVLTPSAPPNSPVVPIRIATLTALPPDQQHGHIYEVTGQLTNSWRVGKLELVTLAADDGSAVVPIVSANGAALPRVGQEVRIQIVAPQSHPLERYIGVPLYLQANTHWEVVQ